MTEEELKFETEHIGFALDKLGIPPLAGRMLAYLMISEPPYRSFDEIVEHLQVSKSAVSTTLQYLEQVEMVTHKTLPDGGKRYFRAAPEKWVAQINIHERFRAMVNILNHVLEMRSEQDQELSPQLKEARDMYLYFEKEIPRMFQRWEEMKKKKG